jgi:hypothetical protein
MPHLAQAWSMGITVSMHRRQSTSLLFVSHPQHLEDIIRFITELKIPLPFMI